MYVLISIHTPDDLQKQLASKDDLHDLPTIHRQHVSFHGQRFGESVQARTSLSRHVQPGRDAINQETKKERRQDGQQRVPGRVQAVRPLFQHVRDLRNANVTIGGQQAASHPSSYVMQRNRTLMG